MGVEGSCFLFATHKEENNKRNRHEAPFFLVILTPNKNIVAPTYLSLRVGPGGLEGVRQVAGSDLPSALLVHLRVRIWAGLGLRLGLRLRL